jgi:hypothetical protein
MYSIIAFGKTIFRDLKPYNKITLWHFFYFFFLNIWIFYTKTWHDARYELITDFTKNLYDTSRCFHN